MDLVTLHDGCEVFGLRRDVPGADLLRRIDSCVPKHLRELFDRQTSVKGNLCRGVPLVMHTDVAHPY